MITYRDLGLCGRLGNQLWQVAATIGIANRRNVPARLPGDWDYRPYFSIPDETFGDCTHASDATDLAEHLHPQARPYLQDWSLFAHIEPEIRRLLLPTAKALTTTLQHPDFWALPQPVLSVHIRRGDNVPGVDPYPNKHLYHPLPALDYYKRAIALHHGHYRSIAVFGDDPEWNEANIDGDYFHHGQPRVKEHEPAYRTEPFTDWVDLFLMAACDHHVLSNSSFGWWGAFLADSPAPVAPNPWFGPEVRAFTDETLMFPPHWRRLDREC